MRLVLFDLDNTLLAGDSDYEWGQFLSLHGVQDTAISQERNLEYYRQYQEGTLNIDDFLAFQLEPLSHHSPDQLRNLHQQFMVERILPLISIQSRALVEMEKKRSTLIAIVTATNRFVTGPIATELGVTHLVATEPERDERGYYTGRVQGTPCFREGKIVRVTEWLASLGHHWNDFSETSFYSDSLNDLPLLKKTSIPIAVNPDPTLKAYATEHQWPIIYLKDSHA